MNTELFVAIPCAAIILISVLNRKPTTPLRRELAAFYVDFRCEMTAFLAEVRIETVALRGAFRLGWRRPQPRIVRIESPLGLPTRNVTGMPTTPSGVVLRRT